jgi:nitroreductase/NAD-dependent dihydropyrimidine dehydrogenase PreA subunit
MTEIIVDQDRCTQCGICTTVCPLGFTFEADETKLPQALEKVAPFCLNCGHCEISCPAGALTLNFALGEKSDNAVELDGISPDRLCMYLKSRRSVRHFTSQKVDKEKILQMLDIARYAASGSNSQPVAWTVVYDGQEVHRLAGLTIDWIRHLYESKDPMGMALYPLVTAWELGVDAICRSAPHLLVAHIPENHMSAPTDGIIALTHFDITAPSFGVGTCWAGFLTAAARSWKPLQDALALPQGRVISYAMMFGYPQHKIYRIPRRNPLQITWR